MELNKEYKIEDEALLDLLIKIESALNDLTLFKDKYKGSFDYNLNIDKINGDGSWIANIVIRYEKQEDKKGSKSIIEPPTLL